MQRLNVEIKARCPDHAPVRAALAEMRAREVGTDHQVDTYFRVQEGRLKLREGEIENALIYYRRSDQAGPKRSDVLLYKPAPGSAIKSMLLQALGAWAVVDKRRQILFVDNVKIHLDDVEGLGRFVEIEAIDADGTRGEDALRAQCESLMERLGIEPEWLLESSYSDMIADRR